MLTGDRKKVKLFNTFPASVFSLKGNSALIVGNGINHVVMGLQHRIGTTKIGRKGIPSYSKCILVVMD